MKYILIAIVFILLPTQAVNAQQRSFTTAQVAEHNTTTNCWVIYDQKVYDISEYISGKNNSIDLSEYCGENISQPIKDAIDSGNTQVAVFLKDYFIGLQSNSSAPISLQPKTAGLNIELGWLAACLYLGGIVFVLAAGYKLTRKFAD